jgi:hypothetical protein
MNESEQLLAIAHESRLIAFAPDVPADHEVERMAARAHDLAGSAARNPRRRWQVAVALTLVAGAASFALALATGHQTTAFARERAAQALMFHADGRVAHVEMTLSMKSRGAGNNPRDDVDQRWSTWIDADGKRIREEFTNGTDGLLEELTVRADGRVVTLLTGRQYKKALLVVTDGQPIETAFDEEANVMRCGIADGSAKVTGTKTLDGDEYWVVELNLKSDAGDTVETVTMRKSDYRLRTWTLVSTDKVQNGTAVTSKQATVQVVEQLAPNSLPQGFFSQDAVRAAYKAATSANKP